MANPNDPDFGLPNGPIDRLVKPIDRFLHVEAAGGIVLVVATLVALVLANSPASDWFIGLWKTPVTLGVGSFEMSHSLKHWISDGLMAIFFFVIGLEVKRELVLGELKDPRKAALPVAAAFGGMLVPAGIYFALQHGQPTASGWGIPMATDIAFVVGCLAVLGPRVPHGLRVLLLSLAIADDIGAILVIAIGYTDDLQGMPLFLGFVGLGAVRLLARLGVRSFLVYTVMGVLIWVAFHESGVHATLAGVLLGLMTPATTLVKESVFRRVLDHASSVFRDGEWEVEPERAAKVRKFQRVARETIPPLTYLEGALHSWSAFLIIPLFALVNAAVPFQLSDVTEPVSVAVMAGLVLGKPVGIVLFSWLAIRLKMASLPQGVSWRALIGGGCLEGIGFTMAIFIAGLALDEQYLGAAKVGILFGSAIAAVIGMTFLLIVLPKPAAAEAEVPLGQ